MGHVYQNLEVWKQSMDLCLQAYEYIKLLPSEERFALADQMRRCAVSVPSNIAEGSGRNTNKEFIQFLYIANGSLCELETQLLLAHKLNYLKDIEKICAKMTSIKKQINSFISYLKDQR